MVQADRRKHQSHSDQLESMQAWTDMIMSGSKDPQICLNWAQNQSGTYGLHRGHGWIHELFKDSFKGTHIFWTASRQLDFTTYFKAVNASRTPLSQNGTETTTATTTATTTSARGCQQHQIELRALTNVAFPEPPAVVQHIVLEDQTHPSHWRRRNDPVPQDGFQDPNPIIALQLGDLITFSSNGFDHNSELAPRPFPEPVPRRHGEVKLCKLTELLFYRPCACLSKGLCSRCRNMLSGRLRLDAL